MPRNFRRLALIPVLVVAAGVLGARAKEAPPIEEGSFRPPDLVELTALDPTIRLDIRYASANNFVGRPVYTKARAFLQRPAAEALVRAHRALRKDGYGLLVFDGYRPWSVTKLFWDLTPEDKKVFVADPKKGSKHNRGCAVDLTLYELATGKEGEMPGAYDEMSERSYPTYSGGSAEARARRDLLRAAMEREGFFVYPWEWWHFDYKDWRDYPILNVAFAEIGRGSTTAASSQKPLDLAAAHIIDLTHAFDEHTPPVHVFERGRSADEVPLRQLIARAVVVDVSARAARDPDYRLSVDDVRRFETARGRIPEGAIVLLRTGWGKRWRDASQLHFPSYGKEAAELLVRDRKVAVLGVDTPSIDHGPAQDFPVHRIAAAANVSAFENLAALEELPETGAWIVALPMKIGGGSGAPLRIVALVP